MSRHRRIALYTLLGVFLLTGGGIAVWYALSQRPTELLLGRWDFGGSDEVAFLRDGRMVLTGETMVVGPFGAETKREQYKGHYEVSGRDRLHIQATIFLGMRLDEKHRFEVSSDELRLYPTEGPVRVARRVR